MSDSRSRKREKSPRWRKQLRYQWSLWLMRYLWLIALVAIVAGFGGFHFFTNWRARDLAIKAQENFRRGDYRMAWLQMQTAREMRPDDVEVLRAGALLEAKLGQPDALATMQDLEKKTTLGAEEIKEKASAAARFGSEEEFENAVKKLEAMGAGDAYSLRAARAELRGDLDRAIVEARRAIEASDKPETRLDLARALGKRHGYSLRLLGQPAPEDAPALREVVQIIDSLQSGKLAEPALALGLTTAPADADTKKRWADAGMKNLSPSNPALLPAAEFLAQSGAVSSQNLRDRLRPIYDSASLAQRADFALWVSRQGMPREALTMVTAQEAADDMSAFLARTDGLARLSNWEGVLEATTVAKKVPESLRYLTRAWAVAHLPEEGGKRRSLDSVVEAAVQAAAKEKQLRPMMVSLDSIGAGSIAEAELMRLCATPATTDAALSLLRERIGKTKGTAALETVYQSAKSAAPTAPSVADYGRYLELFGGVQISPADTTSAIDAQPGELSPRVTHALLMLRENNPAAAKATFDDITVFFDQMSPAQQAVVAAYTAGTGDMELARKMRGVIRTEVLSAGEIAVLDQWVPAGGEEAAR